MVLQQGSTHAVQTPQSPVVPVVPHYHIAEVVLGVLEIAESSLSHEDFSKSHEVVIVARVDSDELLIAVGGFMEVGGLLVDDSHLLPCFGITRIALNMGVQPVDILVLSHFELHYSSVTLSRDRCLLRLS